MTECLHTYGLETAWKEEAVAWLKVPSQNTNRGAEENDVKSHNAGPKTEKPRIRRRNVNHRAATLGALLMPRLPLPNIKSTKTKAVTSNTKN
jgi:hypothetical protein